MSFAPGWEPAPDPPEPWWPPPPPRDGYWIDMTGPGSTGTRVVAAADGTLVTPDHLCPDLLRWENIGPADGLRGRVVRGFFALLRLWPPGGTR